MSARINPHSIITDEEDREFHRLLNKMWSDQIRLELIEEGKEIGEKRGIKKTLKRDIKTAFRRFQKLGINEKDALQYICEDCPQVSADDIRKILNV